MVVVDDPAWVDGGVQILVISPLFSFAVDDLIELWANTTVLEAFRIYDSLHSVAREGPNLFD